MKTHLIKSAAFMQIAALGTICHAWPPKTPPQGSPTGSSEKGIFSREGEESSEDPRARTPLQEFSSSKEKETSELRILMENLKLKEPVVSPKTESQQEVYQVLGAPGEISQCHLPLEGFSMLEDIFKRDFDKKVPLKVKSNEENIVLRDKREKVIERFRDAVTAFSDGLKNKIRAHAFPKDQSFINDLSEKFCLAVGQSERENTEVGSEACTLFGQLVMGFANQLVEDKEILIQKYFSYLHDRVLSNQFLTALEDGVLFKGEKVFKKLEEEKALLWREKVEKCLKEMEEIRQGMCRINDDIECLKYDVADAKSHAELLKVHGGVAGTIPTFSNVPAESAPSKTQEEIEVLCTELGQRLEVIRTKCADANASSSKCIEDLELLEKESKLYSQKVPQKKRQVFSLKASPSSDILADEAELRKEIRRSIYNDLLQLSEEIKGLEGEIEIARRNAEENARQITSLKGKTAEISENYFDTVNRQEDLKNIEDRKECNQIDSERSLEGGPLSRSMRESVGQKREEQPALQPRRNCFNWLCS